MNNNFISQDLFDQMFKDRQVRTSITKESHLYFFHFYMAEYVKYATAVFQKEIFALTEDENLKNLFIVAFRGSGKSTIITTSYPLWSILGKQKKRFVLILCQTKAQAKQHMMNLRRELESNTLLKNDLGPFQEEPDEWGSGSLVFSNLDARITVASSEQSIRGVRHGPHRPDLIIADDVEDLASTKTKEGREKTYQWLTGEVMPGGDRNTKLVVIGNLLHEDSLLMKLKRDVDEGKLQGVFKSYPLLVGDNQIMWPGKYPTLDDVETARKATGNENAWQREYMLKILPADDQVIFREWIQYYDVMPNYKHLRSIRIGVDLAISEKETADYTAMVTGWLFSDEENGRSKVYIDPIIVNKKMDFPTTMKKCMEIHATLKTIRRPDFAIENVSYQRSLPQMLKENGLSAREIKVGSQDKRSRLAIASHKIKNGEILFPRKGAEDLINQMVHFGTERHDDIADAFVALVIDVIDYQPARPQISWVGCGDDGPSSHNYDTPFCHGGTWRTLC